MHHDLYCSNLEIWDSLGTDINLLKRHLPWTCKATYNIDPMQGPDSTNCGLFVAYISKLSDFAFTKIDNNLTFVVYNRVLNFDQSYKTLVNTLFSPNHPDINDKKVRRICKQ